MIGGYEATHADRAKAFGRAIAAIGLLTLWLAAGAQASKEYEPNDSRETAYGPLAGGTTYTATLETENDSDWYLFYVKTYSQMEISGAMLPGAHCTGSIRYTEVLDADGDELTSFSIGAPNEIGRLNVTLNPGRYYLKLKSRWSECNGDRYNFRIDPAASITTSRECGEAIVAKDLAGPQLNTVNQELAKNAERLARKTEAVHEAKRKLQRASKKVKRLRKRRRVSGWQMRSARQAVQRAIEQLDTAKESRAPVWQEKLSLDAIAAQHQQAIAAAEAQIAARC